MKNFGKIISISLFAISLAMLGILFSNKRADSAEEQQELTGTRKPAGAVIDSTLLPPVVPAAQKAAEAAVKPAAEDGKHSLRVVSTKPTQNYKDHSPLEKNVVLNFSSPLDAETFKGAISVKPEGKIKVVVGEDKSTQVVVTFLDPISSASDFSLIIAKSVKSRSGDELGADFRLNFKTSLFKVAASWPKDGERNVPVKSYPYIFFNASADRVSAGKSIKLSPEAEFELVWREETNGVPYCVLKHTELFKPNTRYVLSVDNTALDKWGDPLIAPFSAVFTTEDLK